MQIVNKIYQVGGSLTGLTWTTGEANYDDCNTYILDTNAGLIMFDCGIGATLNQIFDNMRHWKLNPDDIKACFLTHSHMDHAGAAYLLKARGVALYAHRLTAQSIASGDERCCGYLYHKPFTPCTVARALEDGDSVELCGYTINVLHLPGHTAGCTAYSLTHEGRQIVVSGDVIGTLLDGYFGWNGSIDFDKSSYMQSLIRFAKCDFDMMLPGHGMVYCHQPKYRIEQALNQALCQWR